jgi:hypothetical protein
MDQLAATLPQDLTVPDVLPDVQPDLNAPGIITAEVHTEPAVSIDNVEQLTLIINTMLQLPAPPKHT